MFKRRQERGGTAASLAALNEVPMQRELIVESDSGKIKVGDGVTTYNNLPYSGGTGTGITPGDKGDITVSGAGAWTIDSGAVTTAKLADSAVTNVKQDNMATKTYKGRTSPASGPPEDVSVATLKTDLALTKADVGLSNLQNLDQTNASNLTSGTIPGERLPSISTTVKGGVPATGTPTGKFLKDDGTWTAVPGGGDLLAANNLSDIANAATARLNLGITEAYVSRPLDLIVEPVFGITDLVITYTIPAQSSRKTSDASRFDLIVNRLGTYNTILPVDGNSTIVDNFTVPANVILFAAGGVITIPNGKTLTIMTQPLGGPVPMFNCVGTGKVVWGKPVEAYFQWWGAVDDAGNITQGTLSDPGPATGTDNYDRLQKALTSLNDAGGGTLYAPCKNGFIIAGNTPVIIDSFRNVRIIGNRSMNTYNGTTFVFTGTPTSGIQARSVTAIRIDGIGFYYTNPAFTGNLLHISTSGSDSAYCGITNSNFAGREYRVPTANAGLKWQNTIDSWVDACEFTCTIYGIDTQGYVIVMSVTNCIFVYLQSYGIFLRAGMESWKIQNNNTEGSSPWYDSGGGVVGSRYQSNFVLKIVGSAWSIDFSHNWIGDGSASPESDGAFIHVQNCYGFTAINNRVANYGGTLQWAFEIIGCIGVTIMNNRFEYLKEIKFSTEYTTSSVLIGNDPADPLQNDWSYTSGYVHLNARSTITNGLIIGGGPGTDPLPTSVTQICLGRLSSPVSAGSGTTGVGIRVNSVGGETGINSAVICESPYTEGVINPWVFYVYRTKRLEIGDSVICYAPLKVGAGGTAKSQEKHGTATLVAGVATITDATITANARVFVNRFSDGGTVAASYSVSRVAGTSFTITAKDGTGANQTADTSVVAYEVIEP